MNTASITPTEAAIISLGALTLWGLYRRLFAKSPLSVLPGPPSPSFIYGHLNQVFDPNGWDFFNRLQENYEAVIRLDGLLKTDLLYVFDPLALHHMLLKNQDAFDTPKAAVAINHTLFGRGLFSIEGEEHRKQRKLLNPVFSVKHLRDVLPVLYPIAHQLRAGIRNEIKKGVEYIDIVDWSTRAALEYIGQGGLGHSFSSFDENGKGDAYGSAIKVIFPMVYKLFRFKDVLPYFTKLGTPKLRQTALGMFPHGMVTEIRDAVNTVAEASAQVLSNKITALEKGDEAMENMAGKGKDILSVLMKAANKDEITQENLVGHMNTLIFAATDSTTSAISRVLSILAEHQDIQSQLRKEVTAARQTYGDLDYDTLQSLPLLDAVCRETLRLYAPVPNIVRVALKDTFLPLLWPIKSTDGRTEIKEILVPKGTDIVIAIMSANKSKKIWGEDAEEWNPSRWLGPTPETTQRAHLPGVYSQMMTFNSGKRSCIGFKFSEMELKMVLSVLLESFIFEPGPPVRWEMGIITVPRVIGTASNVPQLPLKIRSVD